MAVVKPFRAVRYNERLLKYAENLMAPPYDVISPEQQELYYDQSPFNIIRLILGKEFPGDSEGYNRYTRARDFLDNWQRDKILVTDDELSLYGYSQIYREPTGRTVRRDGFVALLFIEEWEKGSVFPHERTYSGPKADRLRLVRATRHQMSFIFSLYSDPPGETAPLIKGINESPEVTRYLDEEGVEHIFTRCTDREIHAALSATMKDKKVFIADGHHRYETFLAFRDELDRQGVKADGHRWAIMYFAPLEGDAITILPCHRIISTAKPINEPAVVKELGRFFTVETYDASDRNAALFIEALEHKGKGSFGFYTGRDHYYLLTLSDLTPDGSLLSRRYER